MMTHQANEDLHTTVPLNGKKDSLKGKENLLHMQGKSSLNLEFKDLTYRVRVRDEQKVILNKISGKFEAGNLIALMGPSGAGKSTLTNILAGYITKNIEGKILVNGRERSLRKFRKSSSYIMQEDLLLPHLSVHEAMTCSANLRLRQSTQQKEAMIQSILDLLGLQDCRHTRTSALSGGQRKRLAIAQELLSNPPIMFFDEPTSGLDSASCFQCVSLLQQLAAGGRTIICTIHQPSAKLFEKFHWLYFVSRGLCLYNGPANDVVDYLSSQGHVCPSYHNPTDFFMELVCASTFATDAAADGGSDREVDCVESLAAAVRRGECGQFSAKRASNSVEGENGDCHCLQQQQQLKQHTTVAFAAANSTESDSDSNQEDEVKGHFSTGTLNQFRVLYYRTFLSIIRDTQLTRLRLLSHVSVGLLIGMLYFQIGNDGQKVQSNAGCLFFCMLFLMFTALMPTVLTFPIEMKIFLREHLNYWYSVKAYYLAKTLADLPFQIVFPVLYGSIVYFMTGQPVEFVRYFLFLTMCVQISLVAQSFGLLVSAATELESAIFLGPVTAIPILLFSGFFVTFDTIPIYLQWLSYCSYVRYAYEAILEIVYGMNRADLSCSGIDESDDDLLLSPCIPDPKFYLKLFSAANVLVYVDFIVLCVFFVIMRGLCFIILKFRSRASR